MISSRDSLVNLSSFSFLITHAKASTILWRGVWLGLGLQVCICFLDAVGCSGGPCRSLTTGLPEGVRRLGALVEGTAAVADHMLCVFSPEGHVVGVLSATPFSGGLDMVESGVHFLGVF